MTINKLDVAATVNGNTITLELTDQFFFIVERFRAYLVRYRKVGDEC